MRDPQIAKADRTCRSHCNQGENVGTCKYGRRDCPMLMGEPKEAMESIRKCAWLSKKEEAFVEAMFEDACSMQNLLKDSMSYSINLLYELRSKAKDEAEFKKYSMLIEKKSEDCMNILSRLFDYPTPDSNE